MHLPWRDLWRFTFDVVVNSECGCLEDFGVSDMKRGGSFAFIAVECFVCIEECIVLVKVIWSG